MKSCQNHFEICSWLGGRAEIRLRKGRNRAQNSLKFVDKTGSITLSSETLQVKERKICVIIAKGVVNHLADFDFQDILAIIKTGFVYYKLNS